MKKNLMILAGILAISFAQPVLASDAHRHAESHQNMQHGQSDSMEKMKGMFLVKKDIDGYTVSFHAMAVKEGMQHGGTHNFMLKVEKDGKAITDLKANSKVIHPNGESESKMLMKMGDWYMAGYDLGHEGQHQLLVLFKTSDGTKHSGGVYFPENKEDHAHDHAKGSGRAHQH